MALGDDIPPTPAPLNPAPRPLSVKRVKLCWAWEASLRALEKGGGQGSGELFVRLSSCLHVSVSLCRSTVSGWVSSGRWRKSQFQAPHSSSRRPRYPGNQA